MITTRLLVTTGVNLLAVIVATFVARELLRRPTQGASRRATRMFALWWGAFAADTLLNTLTWLAGGAGIASEAVVALLSYPALTCIVLMIWGLMYYLTYLFTGRESLFTPIAVFYALSWVAFVALVIYLHPIGVRMGPYSGEIAYSIQPPAAASLWVAIFFLLPPILGAILYGTLVFRVKERAHRYRILAVSVGIFVWFTSSLVFTGTGAGGDALAITGKVLGLACLGLFLSAYVRPRWLRGGVGADAPRLDPAARHAEDPLHASTRQERRAALRRRVADLI